MDRAISIDIYNQLFVVGFLFDAVIFHFELDVSDRSVNRVDSDNAVRLVRLFVFVSRHVASALLDSQFDIKLDIRFHVTNFKIRVKNLEVIEELVDVTSFKDRLVTDNHSNFFSVFAFNLLAEAYLFEVKDNISNVFYHAFNRSEFMFDSINSD